MAISSSPAAQVGEGCTRREAIRYARTAARKPHKRHCPRGLPSTRTYLQKTIQEQGKVRILILFAEDYRAADMLAIGDLANYAVDHDALEKLALVGAPPWAGGGARSISIHANAELRSFARDKQAAALEWIKS